MHKEVIFINRNINFRRALACQIALFAVLVFAFSAFAEGGDGSGGGKNIPFQFVSSSIPNGSENVKTDTDIVLLFNKNVVNITVRENNMKCFTLKDSGNREIPIDIIMGDDQIEPTQEVKRTVTIKPKSDLSSGETYLLIISKDLQAKNGSYLGKDTYISFSTAAGTSSKPADTTSATAKQVTTEKSQTAAKQIVIAKTTTSAKTNTAESTTAGASQTAAKTTAASSVTAFTTAAGRVTRSTRAASSSKQDKTVKTATSYEKKAVSSEAASAQRTSQAETTLRQSSVTVKNTAQPESVTANAISPETSYPEEDTGYTEYETYEESGADYEDSYAEDSQTNTDGREELTPDEPAEETTGNKTPVIIGAVIFALVLAAVSATAAIKIKNNKT